MADAPDDIPYQSLYRRFRPSTFGAVRGQDHVVLALRNAVRDQRAAHAYLFSGPRGTGKTSTARILAKALNCTDLRDGEPCGVCLSCAEITKGTSLDVHELDAASNNGVEAMRDLVSRASLGTPGRQKVYIVDEVHMLSTAASNALLKTLEEPPAHVVFVLATTDPQKVLPTIKSRTQHFEFRLLGPETLGELLEQVRKDAHLEIPDEALDLAVRRGRGSARDALSVLDQVAASDSVEDDLPELDEVVEALAEHDIGRALVAVAHLTSAGFSPQQLTGDLVDHLRQGFLALLAPDLATVSGSERDALLAQAQRVGLAALVRSMEVLGRAQVSMRDAPDPRVNLEVALVRLAHPAADESPEAMLVRIERLEGSGRSAGVAVPADLPPATPAPSVVASPAVERPTPAVDDARPTASTVRKTLGSVRRQTATVPPEQSPTRQAPAPVEAPATAMASEPAAQPGDLKPAVPAGPFPTRDQLVQAWGDHIIGRLRPKAKALAQAGRFVRVDEDQAVFGLPNESHRVRCEEIRGEVETALSDHFGRHVGLKLVVDGGSDDTSGDIAGREDATSPPSLPSAATGRPGARPRPQPPRTHDVAATGGADVVDDGPDDDEDPSAFDESQLGHVVDVDNSAEARVLLAFPGAEEVN